MADVGPTDEIDMLLAKRTPEAAAELQRIAATAHDRVVRKAARRALFLLGQAGIRAPEGDAAASVTGAPAAAAVVSASGYDGAGNRLLFVFQPDPYGGRTSRSLVMLDARHGVTKFIADRVTPREARQHMESWHDRITDGVVTAAIELDYARDLIAEALEVGRHAGTMAPRGFLEWKDALGRAATAAPEPTVWRHAFDVHESPAPTSADAAALFALPWFETWFLDAPAMAPWAERWILARSGTLIVPESAKVAQRERVALEAAQTLFAGDEPSAYARMLEETADVLWLRDKHDAARLALRHAAALRSAQKPAETPFAVTIARRTLEAVDEMFDAHEGEQIQN